MWPKCFMLFINIFIISAERSLHHHARYTTCHELRLNKSSPVTSFCYNTIKVQAIGFAFNLYRIQSKWTEVLNKRKGFVKRINWTIRLRLKIEYLRVQDGRGEARGQGGIKWYFSPSAYTRHCSPKEIKWLLRIVSINSTLFRYTTWIAQLLFSV